MGAVISCEDQRSLEPEAESVQTERSNWVPAHAEHQREFRPPSTADLTEELSKTPLASCLTLSGPRPDEGTGESHLKETEGPTWAQHN